MMLPHALHLQSEKEPLHHCVVTTVVGGVRELAAPACSQPVGGDQRECFVAPNGPDLQLQLCTQAATAVAAPTSTEDHLGLKAERAHRSFCAGALARRVPSPKFDSAQDAPLKTTGRAGDCPHAGAISAKPPDTFDRFGPPNSISFHARLSIEFARDERD